MTFYYHMYGDNMSCIVIYIKRQDSNNLKPLWLKSENRGDLWIRGQISINESSVYQVSHICIFICLFCLFIFFNFICFCESHLLYDILMRPINKIAELKLTIKSAHFGITRPTQSWPNVFASITPSSRFFTFPKYQWKTFVPVFLGTFISSLKGG